MFLTPSCEIRWNRYCPMEMVWLFDDILALWNGRMRRNYVEIRICRLERRG